MRRSTLLPIDSEKLRELVLNKGTFTDIATEMGYSPSLFTQTFKRRSVSLPVKELLEMKYGIKYEDYKPEEKKEEPIVEKPIAETEVLSKDEALLKTIISQLSALNNGLNAIYQKLEQIDADIKVWED